MVEDVPHFPLDEVLEPEPKGKDVTKIASEVPQRFARLQRKYGALGWHIWNRCFAPPITPLVQILPKPPQSTGGTVVDNPEPTIRLNAMWLIPDISSPACGLLELAYRVYGQAEEWFSDEQFHISSAPSI